MMPLSQVIGRLRAIHSELWNLNVYLKNKPGITYQQLEEESRQIGDVSEIIEREIKYLKKLQEEILKEKKDAEVVAEILRQAFKPK